MFGLFKRRKNKSLGTKQKHPVAPFYGFVDGRELTVEQSLDLELRFRLGQRVVFEGRESQYYEVIKVDEAAGKVYLNKTSGMEPARMGFYFVPKW
jgi:hypothetical protein